LEEIHYFIHVQTTTLQPQQSEERLNDGAFESGAPIRDRKRNLPLFLQCASKDRGNERSIHFDAGRHHQNLLRCERGIAFEEIQQTVMQYFDLSQWAVARVDSQRIVVRGQGRLRPILTSVLQSQNV